MGILDEKGRLFGKVNLFDLIVLLVLIALVTGVGYKYLVSNNNIILNQSDIQVKLWIEDVKDVSVKAINVGDIVREYDSNNLFGEVIKKEVKPHYEEVETADGRVVHAPVEGKHDVYVTLKCKGIVSDNAISIGSKEVRIGGTIVIKHKLYALSTKAIEIIEK
jgi:hypothetical protein